MWHSFWHSVWHSIWHSLGYMFGSRRPPLHPEAHYIHIPQSRWAGSKTRQKEGGDEDKKEDGKVGGGRRLAPLLKSSDPHLAGEKMEATSSNFRKAPARPAHSQRRAAETRYTAPSLPRHCPSGHPQPGVRYPKATWPVDWRNMKEPWYPVVFWDVFC